MRLNNSKLKEIARKVKLLILEISYKAKTGHVGSCLSISDILTVLFFSKLNIVNTKDPAQKKDIFILSKGHAAAALYVVLYKKRILSKKQLFSFGQDGGLCEHPEIKDPGIEMSTGSLGQGLGFGLGVALAQRKLGTKNNTFVLISDGECGEGSVWEAALLAPRLKLNNLTVIVDYNKWQCFGKSTEISNLEPFKSKWRSFGWEVKEVNGHDLASLKTIFEKLPFDHTKPSLLIA